jgi:hypothetical protein
VLCSTVDYSGSGYIPKDTIEGVVYQRTPRETMKDDSCFKEQMLSFFVKYAICAVPKESSYCVCSKEVEGYKVDTRHRG